MHKKHHPRSNLPFHSYFEPSGDEDQTHASELRSEEILRRLQNMLNVMKKSGDVPLDAQIHVFGSYNNGFKTGGSDLDVV